MKLAMLRLAHLPHYKKLMRTDKPIGTLLLLWPTYWALWLANSGMPSWWLLLIFSAGVFVMRSAGCVINDYADRHVDGAVERTKARVLAQQQVSEKEALSLFVLLIGCAFVLVLCLNLNTLWLSFGALALAACYPFMKRYTHLPQVVLGAAFSWAIPMAYMASNNAVPAQAWWLFAANLCWTVAYDTLYAMVDREDDKKIGVKSTAILFAKADLFMVALLNTVFIGVLIFIGLSGEFSTPYWLGIGLASGLLIRQLWQCRKRDTQRCFAAFLNNHYVGMVIFFAIAAHYWQV